DENGLPFINEDTGHVMRRIARILAIHGPENGKEPNAPQSHEDLTVAEVSELLGKMQEIKSDLDASTVIGDSLAKFVIYSPENQSLRVFQREGQIEPLGIHGEGLLKFLQVLNEAPEYSDALASLRAQLRV
uniref:hypothetical protein n=1 Tax=Stenotrophomonas sp. GbtcB23 TaxID=2824768 RepID=UPI001C302060